MRRLTKILLFALAGILVLGLALIAVSQTAFFRDWLRRTAIDTVNRALAGKLNVETLSGNLITRIELENLSVRVDEDSLLRVGRLVLEYNPLSLLTGKVSVSALSIETLDLDLGRDQEGRWNFSRLIEKPSADQEAAAAPATEWDLELPAIAISNSSVTLDTSSGGTVQAPFKVSGLDFDLGFWYEGGRTRFVLEKMAFQTISPELQVAEMYADFESSQDSMALGHFQLSTGASKLSAAAEIALGETPSVNVLFSAQPLSLAEIRKFITGIEVFGSPRFEFSFQGPLSHLETECKLQIGQASFFVTGPVSIDREPFGYDLTGNVSGLDLAELTGLDSLTSDINFHFHLAGEGLEVGTLTSHLKVELDSSRAMGYSINPSVFTMDMAADTIEVATNLNVENAVAKLSGKLLMLNEGLSYSLDGSLLHLDVGRFSTQTLATDLSLALQMRGSGTTMATASAVLSLQAGPSIVSGIPVDSAQIKFELIDEVLQVRQFVINSPLGALSAAGQMSVKHDNQLRLEAEFSDFSVLASLLPADSLRGKGAFSAAIGGAHDSLNIAADFDFTELGLSDLHVARFKGGVQGLVGAPGLNVDFTGALFGLSGSETIVDTANFTIQLVDSVVNFVLDFERDLQYAANAEGYLALGSKENVVHIDDLGASFFGQDWALISDDVILSIKNNRYSLTRLELENHEEILTLSGSIDTEKSSDFLVSLKHVDISNYSALAARDIELGGLANLDARFSGTFKKPSFDVSMSLAGGKYLDVNFDKLSGKVGLSNKLLTWRFSIAKTATDSLMETSGRLPVRFALGPYDFELLQDVPLEMKASTRGLDISFMQAFAAGVKNIRGILVADVVFRNTLNDLRGVGPIRLINGGLDVPELGTSYKKANIVLVLDGKDIILQEVGMRSGSGYIKLIEGGLSLSKDQIENFKAKFKVKRFELINNEKMQARVQGTVSVSGSIQEPRFSGDLLVDQAKIYYDKFEEETAVLLSSRPFFVIGPDSSVADTLGAFRFQKAGAVQEALFTELAFYRNLRGELSLLMPRNIWVRSSDTSIEVECDLSAVKENPELVLFGHCSTIRGFYELFGNRFQIQSGDFDFDGEPDMNPAISIEAITIVTDKPTDETRPEKHEFKVRITGTLFFPEFQFLLDDSPAAQEDIISILVFGQTFDQLAPGQQSQVGEEKGLDDRAKGLVTGRLLKQLSNALGSELRLDVIEIESGDSISDSKVRVGKYVTPEVFVSVSQDFGTEGNQIVELEYEIPQKILFFKLLLQATSDRKGDTGMDVIWKIEW